MGNPEERPRNITWNGPNDEVGRIEFKWGDPSNPVPTGFSILVKAKDGRGLKHEDAQQFESYESSKRRAIELVNEMIRSLE
jgi:hypothetical protein